MSKKKTSPGSSATLPMAVALAATAIAALALGSLLTTSQGCKPGVGGASTVANVSPEPAQSSESPTVVPPPDRVDASPGAAHNVFVYKIVPGGDNNPPRLEAVKTTLTPEQAKTPASAVLEAMVGAPDSPLPKGTKVRSVKIADGTATVDFSEEFQKNFDGGDNNEAIVINAVTAALGQFSTVQRVQILVEGKKIDSLGGNQDLTEPVPIPQLAADGTPKTASAGDGGGQ